MGSCPMERLMSDRRRALARVGSGVPPCKTLRLKENLKNTKSRAYPLKATGPRTSAPSAHTAPARGRSLQFPTCRTSWPRGERDEGMESVPRKPDAFTIFPLRDSAKHPAWAFVCTCETLLQCIACFFFVSCLNWQLCFLKRNELKIQILREDKYP